MHLNHDSSALVLTQKPDKRTLVVSSKDEALLQKARALLELLQDKLAYSSPEQMSGMIDSIMPLLETPSPVALAQVKRNAEARMELVREFGLLTSGELHEQAGMTAANKAAVANRWKKEHRIISVRHQGRTLFPAFQFDDEGQPLPVVAQVLKAFGEDGWQTALWFTTPNGWLDGRRPVDLLKSEPDAVVAAARQEAESAF